MGLIRVFLCTFSIIILGLISSAYAAWNGPHAVVNLGWGNGFGQVAIEHGDTEDSFPHIFVVDEQGKILLSDGGNVRLQIISPDGSLSKIVPPIGWPADISGWPLRLTLLSNSRVLIKRGDRYQIYNYDGTLSNEFKGVATHILEITALPDDTIVVYKSDEKKFYLYSPTGQLIKTSVEKPVELGRVKESKQAEKYKIIVEFTDKTFSLLLSGPYEKYVRDSDDHLNALSGKSVKKFDYCGKEIGSLLIPENQYKKIRPGGRGFDALYELIAETGEPVIAPNGDVYTWKRTPDKYSILKWTWVDDPNVPSGPDAPTGFSALPSTTGIYLTWTASPQDPGCVTGYEIARATSSGGVYSSVGSVDKGVVKYNDASTTAGTTYYYKVRAVAGSEYSQYAGPVSGQRP